VHLRAATSARRSRAPRAAGLALLVALPALAVGGAGCAHHAAKQATESMGESIRKSQETTPPERQITYVASQRAIEGAVAALDEPAQRAQIQKLVNAAVTEAVASALRAALAPGAVGGLETGAGDGTGDRGAAAILAGQVGRAATEDALGRVAVALGGEGALSTGLVATSAKATDAAVGAALAELFPECRGDEPAAASCRRERMQALTRATAASVTAGVRDSLAWPLLFLAAAVGLTVGALAHWAVTLRRRRPHAFRHA
jgi:hypothetical protein